jgi:hypothetical protein
MISTYASIHLCFCQPCSLEIILMISAYCRIYHQATFNYAEYRTSRPIVHAHRDACIHLHCIGRNPLGFLSPDMPRMTSLTSLPLSTPAKMKSTHGTILAATEAHTNKLPASVIVGGTRLVNMIGRGAAIHG